MAETCIVCLGDLRGEQIEPDGATHTATQPPLEPHRIRASRSHPEQLDEDDERIAHLLPCCHDLHNGCLKPWVERANSCPICRAKFNEVELKDYIGGPTLSSYGVQDKQQQADLDPTLTIDDSLFEDDDPCIICGTINEAYEVMFCDGCDRSVHVFCAGSQEAPDIWYCQDCVQMLEGDGDLPLAGRSRPRATRVRASRDTIRSRRGRTRRPNSDWARVWQSVWDNLNLDLDFPFDDEPAQSRRTPAQRRDFQAWNQRLRIANRQGAANRFRQTAPALLDQAPPEPESQEELRAWNAFDKARELQEGSTTNRRKRAASTSSPASPKPQTATPERKLKRPRTRRNLPAIQTTQAPESSHQAMSRPEVPGFLTSLLEEVDRQAPVSDHNSPQSPPGDERTPLPGSSPEGSPIISTAGTPRAHSVTPPPLMLSRPMYTPLSSIVRPLLSPPSGAYSPFSPTNAEGSDTENGARRGRRPVVNLQHKRDSSPQSPSRNLSYSTKSEIQRMVKNALGPRYRTGEITKDQYTDINRDVSRMLYERIENANDLADEASRTRLQDLAHSEVGKAITAL